MGTSSSPNEKGEESVNSTEKDGLSRDFEEYVTFLRGVVQGIEERAQVTTWWFTAGLVGFIVLVSGDLGAEVMRAAPLLLTCLMLTFTLGSGIALILSRSSLISSKKSLERASEIDVKLHETWGRRKALIPESLEAEKFATLAKNEQEGLLKLAEKIRSETTGVSSQLDVMMNESKREVVRSAKRSRWGRYLFIISLCLAFFAAMSFLASVWSPAVKAWWPAVSTWWSAVFLA